jgi:hypothetical protein
VKSKGDFADILAEGNPDIWHSNRPARGGETGAMFEKIIARALEMKEAGSSAGAKVPTPAPRSPGASGVKKKTVRPATKTTKRTASKKKTATRRKTRSVGT